MRLLLDTHAALWMFAGSPEIGQDLQAVLTDPAHDLYFSDASAWEIVIKHQIGRLPLPEAPGRWVPRMVRQHRLSPLPIDRSAIFRWGALPRIHRDPFDRMLVAQALCEDLQLVSRDPEVARYPVKTFWI